MAVLYVEIGKPGRPNTGFNQSPTDILGADVLKSDSLAVGTTAATTTLSITAANITAGYEVARLTTDTACYVAVGAAPDPTASPRRAMMANTSVLVKVGASDEIATIGI